MTFKKHALLLAAAVVILIPVAPAVSAQMTAAPAATTTTIAPGLVPKEAVSRLVPPAVFFAGQVASTQARNAAAVRLPGGQFVVATLVDTSGYSSSIQEKYQAYLINEANLSIDGHTLPPGAYGCGFIANDTFIVMDIAGNTLFTAHSTRDTEIRRPPPLQMLATPDPTTYRLYAGRSYITLQPARQ
jgi:hypothetical protein